MIFTKILAVLMTAVSALTITACDKAEEASGNDPVVFSVGDTVMTEAEFGAYVSNYTMYGYPIDMAKEAAKAEAVKNLSLNALVTDFTAEEEQAIKDQKAKIVEAQGGEAGYKNFLKELGTTDSFVDNLIRAQVAAEKLFSQSGAEPDEAALKEEFDNNYYRAKHILISTMDTGTQTPYDDAKKAEQKKKADELFERAKSGEDFDKMVAEYSEDPGSKSQPDGYYFTANEMVKEFEDTTKALKVGEIEMCETSYGYHIIKRYALDEDMDLYNENFEKVKEKIKAAAQTKYIDEQIESMMKEKGLEVKTDQKVYDSIGE